MLFDATVRRYSHIFIACVEYELIVCALNCSVYFFIHAHEFIYLNSPKSRYISKPKLDEKIIKMIHIDVLC